MARHALDYAISVRLASHKYFKHFRTHLMKKYGITFSHWLRMKMEEEITPESSSTAE